LGITTIINTHDMNSVMGIGENILFIYKGHKEWQGVSGQVMRSKNKRLTDFIFASDLLKNMRNLVIENDIEFEHKTHVGEEE
jgi:phospholipid/cholesterol/gamma-HCH transport system ATP-binding protein